ncbi:hypothetical protein ACIRBX_19700 [Kitasatospora sp. NPDC096147]|uniref:hypothetical protein n=1 Tax=Kitasatospora sp. NPDC096147 TaxID=3364093 RepID=UPI0037F6DCF6
MPAVPAVLLVPRVPRPIVIFEGWYRPGRTDLTVPVDHPSPLRLATRATGCWGAAALLLLTVTLALTLAAPAARPYPWPLATALPGLLCAAGWLRAGLRAPSALPTPEDVTPPDTGAEPEAATDAPPPPAVLPRPARPAAYTLGLLYGLGLQALIHLQLPTDPQLLVPLLPVVCFGLLAALGLSVVVAARRHDWVRGAGVRVLRADARAGRPLPAVRVTVGRPVRTEHQSPGRRPGTVSSYVVADLPVRGGKRSCRLRIPYTPDGFAAASALTGRTVWALCAERWRRTDTPAVVLVADDGLVLWAQLTEMEPPEVFGRRTAAPVRLRATRRLAVSTAAREVHRPALVLAALATALGAVGLLASGGPFAQSAALGAAVAAITGPLLARRRAAARLAGLPWTRRTVRNF